MVRVLVNPPRPSLSQANFRVFLSTHLMAHMQYRRIPRILRPNLKPPLVRADIHREPALLIRKQTRRRDVQRWRIAIFRRAEGRKHRPRHRRRLRRHGAFVPVGRGGRRYGDVDGVGRGPRECWELNGAFGDEVHWDGELEADEGPDEVGFLDISFEGGGESKGAFVAVFRGAGEAACQAEVEDCRVFDGGAVGGCAGDGDEAHKGERRG